MCGIHAIFANQIEQTLLERMLATTRHRGDDRDSFSICAGAALAINRLSINDVVHGHQPFISDDGKVLLVCNGEIYNAPAIRDNLEEAQFTTRSDVEVLLHLYERQGAALLDELDGMFAFVLYDQNTGNVLAARDPFGIKPLYFVYADGALYFASEVKSLLLVGVALEDIEALPAGHRLYGKPSANLRPERWYDLDAYRMRSTPSPAFLRRLLDHSVKKCLLRDPGLRVGVFLSGGLDSSIVAALAARHCQELTAFCIGMPGSPDLKAAQLVAAHLGIELVECHFSLEMALAAIPAAIWHVESYNRVLVFEALLTMMLAQAARKAGIKIVLCGEGADEIFAGYNMFREIENRAQVEPTLRRLMSKLGETECLRLDRGTMAHSVEARVPFLDCHVVQYAINLPVGSMLKKTPDGVIEKHLLREAAVGLLPDEIIWRKKAVFENASGILGVIDHLNQSVSDAELAEAQRDFPAARLNNKLAVALYRIFRARFGSGGDKACDVYGTYPLFQSYSEHGSSAQAQQDSN